MAFKSVEQFNDELYHGKFRIPDDGGSQDVIFLYQKKADMLVADVHYIKSATYSGYVHCVGTGCPACKKGIRTQTKLFIPVYNISSGEIEFWDRNMNSGFLTQLDRDVFDNFPNPSEYVFRITRHGAYKDKETRYDIVAVGKNSVLSYDQVMAKFNTSMPAHYEHMVKTVSLNELTDMLQTSGTDSAAAIPDYVPVPRAGYQSSIPDTYVNAAEALGSAAPNTEDIDTSDGGEDTDLVDPVF